MTTKHEQLRKTVDHIINQDADGAVQAFTPYIQAMTREILGYAPRTDLTGPAEVQAAPHTEVVEEGFNKDDVTSPIRLQGDKVLVDGKEVGVVSHDVVADPDSFKFVSSDGKTTKEFTSTKALFDWATTSFVKKTQ